MARKDMTYEEACHAMQSGVAFDQGAGSQCGNPKYLRVGVNSAMCDHAALARLLINAGIITDEQYREAIRLEMIAEVERYEHRLSTKFNKQITLG